jgi:beta-glucanase (GH16 family)
VRDGQWHEVSIPLSAFNNPNQGMHIDLGSVTQTFMFAGDAPGAAADFYVDNIHYSGGVAANPAPTVSLSAPANDALITTPANITITAQAADAGGAVTKVAFYNNNVLLGEDLSAPYSFSWAGAPEGVHTLTAKATDDGGTTTTSAPVTVFVAAPNNTAPAVSLTATPANPTAPATVTLTANATDAAGGSIYKVEFYNGNALLGTDLTAPYSFTWAGVPVGSYTVTAKATDNGKLTTTSDPVTIAVQDNAVLADNFGVYTENAGITQKLAYGQDANLYVWNNLAALPGATPFEGAEVLAFRAAPGAWFGFGIDNDTKNLSHFANGALKFHFKTAYAGPFKVGIKTGGGESWIEFPAGVQKFGLARDGQWHQVVIPVSALANATLVTLDQAFMFAGEAPAAAADFYVDNIHFSSQAPAAPPTVSITAPAPNATFVAPASITITADAADAEGISKVEFYNGADKLGEDATAPYAFAWANAPAGTHSLTAKAFDNGGASASSPAVTITVNGAPADGYTLVWADEFTNGISADWVFETGRGDNGWGNNELQYYRPENASVQNGELVITAKKEPFGGAEYTSARMKTQGRKSFQYGRIEAKIAMPSAQGLWPAFWMLGSSITTEGWPSCGEIDIMEHINTEPKVHGTIHWSSDNGAYANYGGSTPVANVTTAHVYSVEWDASAIRWFMDGVKFHEASILNGVNGTHEFHEDFFLLLNLAVGGNWPGFNVDNSAFPASMYVDYVRVYQKEAPPYTGPTVRLTAPANGATVTPGSTLSITASARDAVNTITRVDFFNGTTLLGTDMQAPYAFNWTNVPAGTHSLTAKVTNDKGGSATSAAIAVQVKDNVVAGDYFGIYTEQAAISNRLVYTQDANLWLWNNLSNITPAPAPFEGNEGLAFRAAPGNWFGFGVDNDVKNLGSYADGDLRFHIKTAYTGHFKVGIKSVRAEKWIEFPAGVEQYGLVRDGQWHEVIIPFAAFGIDLATLDQAFMFAGDAPAVNADFYFDNIFYSAKPADADGDGVTAPADCNDNNAAVYPGAPEKCDGLDNDCDGQVDEGIGMAAPVIAVMPSSNVYTGGNARTIYLGYGPQSVTLTASNTPAAAAYRWSPAAGLSNAAIANPVFTPTAAGSYTFEVTGTNAAGCTATASVTITVINARGTKNRNKVLVCHKGQVQEVSAAEVPVHLGHGDKLGNCNAAASTAARAGNTSGELAGAALTVYPNPTGGRTNVSFTGVPAGNYRLTVFDLKGRPVQEIAAGRSEANGPRRFELDAARFAAGVYVVKLVTDDGVLIQRVVIQRQ